MLTDDRLNKILAGLERWEGRCSWMYQDSASPPRVTVGVGCLVPSLEAAQALPFEAPSGTPAAADQIAADHCRVAAMSGGLHAARYHAITSVYLSDDAIDTLAVHRLVTEFLPGLLRLCPGFETFPDSAQAALIDMAWNLGLAGLAAFPRLLAAANAGDWDTAATESHSSTARQARNDWRAAMFHAAAGITSKSTTDKTTSSDQE